MLVVKDTKGKAVFAFASPQKGIGESRFAVDAIVECVLWLGCSKVILESDNGPAILKLSQAALVALRVTGVDQASEEHPLQYDNQAKGLSRLQ